MAKSPTQNTLELLRKEGYLCQVVEHWNQFARKRNDLFQIIDVLAVRHGETLGVQATSKSNISARVRKIADSENVGPLREAGWKIEVWGWHKEKNRWKVKKVDVS